MAKTYGGGSHTAFLKLLEGGSGSFGSFDKLELRLAPVDAMRIGHGEVAKPNRS